MSETNWREFCDTLEDIAREIREMRKDVKLFTKKMLKTIKDVVKK